TMNTSEPRTDSPKRQCSSPSANSDTLASPSLTSMQSATSSANGRLERPLKSWRRFLVTSSMRCRPSTPVVVPAPCSVERAGARSGGDLAAGSQPGEGPDDGAGADLGVLTHGLLERGPLADGTVGEVDVGTEARAGTHDGV